MTSKTMPPPQKNAGRGNEVSGASSGPMVRTAAKKILIMKPTTSRILVERTNKTISLGYVTHSAHDDIPVRETDHEHSHEVSQAVVPGAGTTE